MPREALDELNSLAAENEKLRAARDEKTSRLEAEIERLRAQLDIKNAEAGGQTKFHWPAIQY
jgi:hypothetical protein